ncbi:RNA-directed DNA polymerase, eukaryota [Tanacetum coccineum]
MQKPLRYLGVKLGDDISKTGWVDTSTIYGLGYLIGRLKLFIGGRLTLLKSVLRFPRLFTLETDKEATVAAKLGASSFDVSFRRAVRDGAERHQWADFHSLSGSVSLSSSKDRWICDLTGDGDFRVKEVRNTLDDLFLPSQPDATRWVKYIPIKINFFAWCVRLDCLPTRSNLIRRGVILDSALCPLCDSTVEDIHHVLFRYDWYAWFSAIRFSSSLKLLLEGVFYVAWWHLWVFRNRSIFDADPPRRSVIFDDIVIVVMSELAGHMAELMVTAAERRRHVTAHRDHQMATATANLGDHTRHRSPSYKFDIFKASFFA